MSAGVDLESVRQFLVELKYLVSREGIIFVPRRNVTKTFAYLGITEAVATDEVLRLTVRNYSSGPTPDHNGTGEVWVFGVDMDGREVYIKLKIFGSGEFRRVKCMSFHEAERAVAYPYRRKT